MRRSSTPETAHLYIAPSPMTDVRRPLSEADQLHVDIMTNHLWQAVDERTSGVKMHEPMAVVIASPDEIEATRRRSEAWQDMKLERIERELLRKLPRSANQTLDLESVGTYQQARGAGTELGILISHPDLRDEVNAVRDYMRNLGNTALRRAGSIALPIATFRDEVPAAASESLEADIAGWKPIAETVVVDSRRNER